MINILNISKNFKKQQVLTDVSFTVNDGEVVGLIGENGAGKSTLLRILSTMLVPTSGTAIISGNDLLNSPNAVRKNIGILFGSEVGLYDRLTAKENLEYFSKLNGMSASESQRRIAELSVQFEFKDYIDKFVGTLSKGMKQKVAIARSIIHNPNNVLFDEPDSGLDFKATKVIFESFEFLKQQGKSLIFSSHSMENIKLFTDRIVVLNKGKIVKNFITSEYRQKYSDMEINDILFNLICGGQDND